MGICPVGICPVGICPVGICPGVFVLESSKVVYNGSTVIVNLSAHANE